MCGPPPTPAAVMMSANPSPFTSPVATRAPPRKFGSYAIHSVKTSVVESIVACGGGVCVGGVSGGVSGGVDGSVGSAGGVVGSPGAGGGVVGSGVVVVSVGVGVVGGSG